MSTGANAAVSMAGQHVAMVSPTAYPDGLAEARGISRELARAGVRITVVCSRISRHLGSGDWEPRVIEVPSRMATVADRFRFARGVAAALRALAPAVVHVYSFRGCAVVPRLAARPRYLYDLRTGNVSGRPWAFLADRLSCSEALSYHRRAVISRAVGRHVCGRGWDNAVVLPLGFSAADAADAREAASLRRQGAGGVPLRIGFVGGLHRERRLDQVLRVIRTLRDRGASHAWVAIGDGADRSRLERVAHELGIASVLTFRGAVPHDAIWREWAELDIVLAYVPGVPEFERQPPLKTIEAMACGLPVVASDTVGNRELIQPGRNGLLAADEPRALAAAIELLARDATLRYRMGATAAETVKSYSWDRIVADVLLPEYQRLLEGDA